MLRRRLTFSATIVVLFAGVVACAGAGPATPSATATPSAMSAMTPSAPATEQLIGTMTFTERGCDFQPASASLHEGPARLEGVNQTDGWAGVHLWQILEGYDYRDFAAHIDKEIQLAEAGEPGLGHPDFVGDLFPIELEAGETDSFSGILRRGTYAFACAWFVESAGEPRPFAAIGPVDVR